MNEDISNGKMEKQNEIKNIKMQIVKALDRSTFHGVDIIMNTPKGFKRWLVSGFVFLMIVCAISGSIYLLISFLNFPYKTLVNYEQKSFEFPEITLCPFSPFSEEKYRSSSTEIKKRYTDVWQFWTNKGKIDQELMRIEFKRSFTATFYQYAGDLLSEWYSVIVSCFYNGESCLDHVIAVEHPMAYNCFQVSLKLNKSDGARSGYARGIELIIYRNGSKYPMLMVNDFFDKIFGEFSNFINDKRKFDGILILLHSKDEMPSFKLTTSPNVYPIVFGKSISLTLKEKYYKQTRTITRRCSKNPVFYELLSLREFFMSRNMKNQSKPRTFNIDNCVSRFRQMLVASRCKCFSESEMIPSNIAKSFESLGFCHDIFFNVKKSRKEILDQIDCLQRIELMTNKEILKISKKEKTYVPCNFPCDRSIISIKKIETDNLEDPLTLSLFTDFFRVLRFKNLRNPFEFYDINKTKLDAQDLIYIDIHAEEERIPILDEDLDKNFSNFVAEIGGVFGLFVGLSGVTAFEIVECGFLLVLIAMLRFSKNRSEN